MKRVFSILAILPFCYFLSAQSIENPFKKLGYDVLRSESLDFSIERFACGIGRTVFKVIYNGTVVVLDSVNDSSQSSQSSQRSKESKELRSKNC